MCIYMIHCIVDFQIVCTKVQEGDQRIVRLKEGDPRGCHVLIVDDLVQSGGTLIECQKVLAKHGAAKISAYVMHGIFPNRSWEHFKHDNGGLNSIGDREFAKECGFYGLKQCGKSCKLRWWNYLRSNIKRGIDEIYMDNGNAETFEDILLS